MCRCFEEIDEQAPAQVLANTTQCCDFVQSAPRQA
jgi:hypothetical protein